jgi:hypothetical protein
MPTHKKKATKHPSEKSRAVPIYVRPHMGGTTAWGVTHCEGLYNCAGDGTIFKVGDRSIIGFWGPKTCPGATTLGDGSVWNLVPLTCKCE